jgi:endo-1,3(4)-beta-glucanase
MSGFSIRIFYLLLLSGLQSLSFAGSSDPTTIFPKTVNKITQSPYWLGNKKPYPTNAWFNNFVTNKASDPVTIFPYLAKLSSQGLSLSYSSPIYYADPDYPTIISAFYYQFENQLTLGSAEPMPDYGLAFHHGMQITLKWQKGEQEIRAPILQGSPYATEFFSAARPQLSSRFKWLSINQLTEQRGVLPENSRYELVLALDEKQTQTWLLYSEKPISLNWSTGPSGEKLTATEPYFGWIRLVLQKDTAKGLENDAAILDAFSQTIPLDYLQSYSSDAKNLSYSFKWQTQNNKAPLMLSLPHQRNSLAKTNPITYSSIKGLMQGETTTQWTIELPKIPILFLEPKTLTAEQSKNLESALHAEAQTFMQRPFPDDGPYRSGKRYARVARLILIANKLKEYKLQKQLLSHIESLLAQKMLGKTKWSFEYDQTWGGIIPSIDDYGARNYNDHHYHYGYWVYTFAIIAKFDPAWLSKPLKANSFPPKEWIGGLIQDYANSDKQNPYFPLQRYQDDYAGHSWASGLTSFKDGQNEQSSSEAVFAYYAIALYASALHDNNLFDWARFLMTRELVSAQTYWQITKNSTIYSDKFKENNQVVANLWDAKIDSNAFFKDCKTKYRCGLEYSFGIEMLPFTAISLPLFNKEWLENSYPSIKKIVAGEYGTITADWYWILIKGISPIMDKNEKDKFFKQALDSKPDNYDLGDSKTNTLYFLIND